jgi:hypothetical protein
LDGGLGIRVRQVKNKLLNSIKHPSAWIPLAMSLAALALVLGSVALFGVVRKADEGPLPTFGSYSWLGKSHS